MKGIEGHWVYDCETYPNIFTLCVEYHNGKGCRVFEISDRKNDIERLLEFCRKLISHEHRLVGFNNNGFDYPVLHYILEKARKAMKAGKKVEINHREIYDVAMKLIKGQDNKFGNSIRDKDVIIPQVDLFKIHHFDNMARATSLKMLEFNMMSDNIEDLPFPVGKYLNDEEKDVLIEYNKHDVSQTRKFYLKSLEAIEFRANLTQRYGFDCTNLNDTAIGKKYFIDQMERVNKGCCYSYDGYGKRTIRQTVRESIALKEVILPYVQFDRPEFKALSEWFSSRTITETKGVFTDIKESDLLDVSKYAEMVLKKKKYKVAPTEQEVLKDKATNPKAWIESIPLKSPKGAYSHYLYWNEVECLNVVVNGFRLDFGVGGIHGSLSSQTVFSDEEFMIIDYDVASYYPNLAISNDLSPEHLGNTFCKVYKRVYEERKSHPKGSAENAVMKLALNGVYGDSNNQYSALYDPKFTMGITINGQLSLCMLIEKFLEFGASLVQANTDGVTIRVKRELSDKMDELVKWWEDVTSLQMERADYSQMSIRDVNNYIAVYTNGKVKCKGAYEHANLGWNKNFSSIVIPMAAEQEIVYGKSAIEFIKNHRNKWDFMLRTKVPRSSRLVMVMENGKEVLQQNICRYYPSKNGGKLVKIMPPLEGKEDKGERRLSIDKEWNVRTCNNINDFEWDLDYDYYYDEVRKLIDPLK